MNETLFRTLLYESEGTTIDFKREQYAFVGADEKTKSEILKDILAFANSWRRANAYILIGVDDVGDGRRNLVGISPTDHIDDASLQQFVNSKTTRKVEFLYEAFHYDGLSFGIITIPKQKRPIYTFKNYGIVEAGKVYLRRGSSCDVATAEELGQMALDDEKEAKSTPIIRVELADLQYGRTLGGRIALKTRNHAPHKKIDLPLYEEPRTSWITVPPISQPNSEYWRELANYVFLQRAFAPIGFAAINSSELLARRVRLEFELPKDEGLKVRHTDNMPSFPSKTWNNLFSSIRLADRKESALVVREYKDRWLLTVEFGDIQPKATNQVGEPVFISANVSGHFSLTGLIYADNISQPQQANIYLDFEIMALPALTKDELEQVTDKVLEDFLKNYDSDE